MKKDRIPKWICGDSEAILDNLNENFNLIFTCPPYFNIERYSKSPLDLSNLTYENFCLKYKSILQKAGALLKINHYAIIVIGDVRDNKGYYRNLIDLTNNIFSEIGFKLYNRAILINPVVSAGIRASFCFEKNKKLTKVHDDILIFKKVSTIIP